ncbi:MAG: hypothetical protein LBK94_12075 [Prevotellaceae bacterium]|jgi:hypothetical protein|nr:hypothetical protein [Prevotellaceae bacterium]
MEEKIKKEDIPVLDYMLNELVKGNIFTYKELVKAKLIDDSLKDSEQQAKFNYYSVILESCDCCEINRGKSVMFSWIIGKGNKTELFKNNGGFATCFKIEEEKRTEEFDRKQQLDKISTLEIQNLECLIKNYPNTARNAKTAITISVISVVIALSGLLWTIITSMH